MEQIKIGKQTIDYEIIRSDRKSIGIIVDKDSNLVIRAPIKTDKEKIKEVISDKSEWILEKLEKVGEIKPAPKPKEFLSGEKLSYLGRKYRLKVKPADIDKARIKLYQGRFLIDYPKAFEGDDGKRISVIRDALTEWYRGKAKIKIKERVDKYREELGVKPNSIKIKNQKTRWGSCSSLDNLNFNFKIIMAPMSIVDYIVVHELAHLIYDNHSREFWQTIKSIIPDYEERREWLRINGRRLDF